MPRTTTTLTAAVDDYLTALRQIRASGGATGERSYYGPLENLLNAVGNTLKPKVLCVGELADQGAGHPDFGLYAAKQLQKGQPKEGQTPERGVVEVKSASDDAWLTADSAQVSRYWERYRLVLVTNTRDFVLVGEDTAGQPATLETYRLAETAEDFTRRLDTPRAFARDIGAGLGEYLCRALSHRAALTEPKDLAWASLGVTKLYYWGKNRVFRYWNCRCKKFSIPIASSGWRSESRRPSTACVPTRLTAWLNSRPTKSVSCAKDKEGYGESRPNSMGRSASRCPAFPC